MPLCPGALVRLSTPAQRTPAPGRYWATCRQRQLITQSPSKSQPLLWTITKRLKPIVVWPALRAPPPASGLPVPIFFCSPHPRRRLGLGIARSRVGKNRASGWSRAGQEKRRRPGSSYVPRWDRPRSDNPRRLPLPCTCSVHRAYMTVRPLFH